MIIRLGHTQLYAYWRTGAEVFPACRNNLTRAGVLRSQIRGLKKGPSGGREHTGAGRSDSIPPGKPRGLLGSLQCGVGWDGFLYVRSSSTASRMDAEQNLNELVARQRAPFLILHAGYGDPTFLAELHALREL
jgi:hypothetical protein